VAKPRNLLVVKNGKMGEFIASFSIPAIRTCPGSTSLCRSACYANSGHFRRLSVRRRLSWNLRQTRCDDFVQRMIDEIRRRGVIVLRIHVAGDVYSADYARKWLTIIRASPLVKFFLYTRSWRIPEIAPVLAEMAREQNARVWYSVDAETGEPETVPPGVRLAFMQHAPEAVPQRSQLVFRTSRAKGLPKFGLPMVHCPQEDDKAVTCGSCQACFR
jgi:hypothetical protein